jgi:internalin A
LDLTGNKLDSLQSSIGDLQSLRILRVGNNEIYHITERIGDLKNLTNLELWSNNIYYLPTGISELEHLEEIDLRGIQMNEEHQDAIKALLGPSVNIKMSISCNCD